MIRGSLFRSSSFESLENESDSSNSFSVLVSTQSYRIQINIFNDLKIEIFLARD